MRILSSLSAILASSLNLLMAGSPAITGYSAGGVGGYSVGGAGFAFSPNTNLAVSALGHYAPSMTAYSEPVAVSIVDAAGNAVVSALVTTIAAERNGHYYESVDSTLLTPGQIYYVRALGSLSGIWLGTAFAPDVGGAVTVAPEINLLGGANITNGAGLFPGRTYPPDFFFVGGNFEFAVVPEPTASSLLGFGLASLWTIGRFCFGRRH